MDHPNVVRLFDSFEDDRSIYLVMELCEGGELFDRIVEAGRLTERQAAVLLRQMLRAVHYLHGEHHVAHRDLKPENYLFASKDAMETSQLKLIDFGLAKCFRDVERLQTAVGSPYYVAPEVLSRNYGPECDLWSLGTILYVLLSGGPPFRGNDDKEILRSIKRGVYDLQHGVWQSVSQGAKDVITGLLTLDPSKRLTAVCALEHGWLRDDSRSSENPHLEVKLVDNLKSWRLAGCFQKQAMAAVAAQLSDAEIHALRDAFLALDTDLSGTLTLVEMRDGLCRSGLDIPPDLEQIMEELDSADHHGEISYSDFLEATIDHKSLTKEDLCWHAFQTFDANQDGKISFQELEQVLQHEFVEEVFGSEAKLHIQDTAKETMTQVDLDGNGSIEFDEFMAMMNRGSFGGS